jgi:hypothetical protein
MAAQIHHGLDRQHHAREDPVAHFAAEVPGSAVPRALRGLPRGQPCRAPRWNRSPRRGAAPLGRYRRSRFPPLA